MSNAHLAGLTLLAAAALLPACRTTDSGTREIAGVTNSSIHVLFDQTHPLPTSGTFAWGVSLIQTRPELNLDFATLQERIHRALDAALPAEGLTRVEENADYLVSFALASADALDEKEFNRAYGDSLVFPPRVESSVPLTYQRGVFILDIVDRQSKHLLWRGAMQADFDLDFAEDKKQARCDAVALELLGHYPLPGAK